MATTYEFVVETLDFYEGCGDNPDIIDTSGWDTLAEAEAFAAQCEEPWRIPLRRDTGNEQEGLIERWYAYPDKNGRLPEFFTDGVIEGPAVPKKYREMTFPVDPRIND